MGFSVVSIIELVYFMSLRPYYNSMRFSEKRGKRIRRFFQRFRPNMRFRKKIDTISVQPKEHVDRIIYPYLEWFLFREQTTFHTSFARSSTSFLLFLIRVLCFGNILEQDCEVLFSLMHNKEKNLQEKSLVPMKNESLTFQFTCCNS